MTHLHGLVGQFALGDLLSVASETSFADLQQNSSSVAERSPNPAPSWLYCISSVEIFNLPSPFICPGVWTKEGKGVRRVRATPKWTYSQVELPYFFRIY